MSSDEGDDDGVADPNQVEQFIDEGDDTLNLNQSNSKGGKSAKAKKLKVPAELDVEVETDTYDSDGVIVFNRKVQIKANLGKRKNKIKNKVLMGPNPSAEQRQIFLTVRLDLLMKIRIGASKNGARNLSNLKNGRPNTGKYRRTPRRGTIDQKPLEVINNILLHHMMMTIRERRTVILVRKNHA